MSKLTKPEIQSLISERFPGFEPTGNLQELAGGNLNHVWRLEGDGESLIIKHAPPYIASNPGVPLSSERIDFEARALQLFSPTGKFHALASGNIRPPELLFFDPEQSILIMEDLKCFAPLDNGFLKDTGPEKIGNQLGSFIGQLHAVSFDDSTLWESFNNAAIQNTRYEVQYNPAYQYTGDDVVSEEEREEIRKNTEALGKELQQPGRCLVMGDLWPPSILVRDNDEIRLIDWEFAHYGRPLQDLGHLAAHCIMQEQMAGTPLGKKNWKLFWQNFWDSYKQNISNNLKRFIMDESEERAFHIHLGAEILIRAGGPFQEGYVYGSEKEHLKQRKAAIRMAADFISGENKKIGV